MRFALGLALLATMLTANTAWGAAPEQRWDIRLDNFFSKGTMPLFLYARVRDGEFVSVVGSSRHPTKQGGKTYNRSWYCGDLSGLTLKDGAMKGRLTIHLTPDLWVPLDHKSFPVTLAIETEGNGKEMKGSWSVIEVKSDDPTANFGSGGALSGKSRPYTPKPLPDPVTFTCNMQGALIGGDPTFGGRCMVLKLGFQGGELKSTYQAQLSQKFEVYGDKPFRAPGHTLSYSQDHLRGRIAVPEKTLDMDPATYIFEIDGAPMETLLVGTYKLTVKVDGKPDIEFTGSFDGRVSKGMKEMAVVDNRPWFRGEHPRLLFTRDELPALRRKARTPEGQAILARLRQQLNGSDGRTMPPVYSPATKAYQLDKHQKKALERDGVYTMGHVAGYGLLYQLTGDQLYADLGKQCFEKALQGVRDRDDRYSFRDPGGALRAGPSIGWYAVGYDLCCDGWDEETRKRFGLALWEYDEGGKKGYDLEALARGTKPPGSNHFGMEVGGASLALLVLRGEPFVEQNRLDRLLMVARDSMIRNLSEGWGDGGFFDEGDGTGSMSSQISFLPAVWAWKNAFGLDFINVERSNARMMTLKWVYQTVFHDGRPVVWPIRGAYGHNVWARRGLSGAGYYSIGIGSVTEEQKAAMKWCYEEFLLDHDRKAGGPYDTVGPYPHHAVCAFVNWPVEMEARQPAEVLPHCYRDSTCGFYAWRNRWQDGKDTVITALSTRTQGYMEAKPDREFHLQTEGRRIKWGTVSEGKSRYWKMTPMGDTSSLVMKDGSCMGVDFTGAGGADTMLVTTGPAEGQKVKLGGKTLVFFFPTADNAPQVRVSGGAAVVGRQKVTIEDGHLVFAVEGQ